MKKQIKWTEDKIEYLKENYGKGNLTELANHFGITTGAVKDMANKRLGLKSSFDKKEYKLKKLLDDTYFNWYWYGFIAGDGNFTKSYLRITLSNEDRNHLEKLANFLNCRLATSNKGYPVLSVGDISYYSLVKEKLGYTNPTSKTTYPLKINIPEDKDLFFCYFIGFVDADGCISTKDGRAIQLKIEIHSSWIGNLKLFQNFLKEYLDIESTVTISSRGFALIRITSHENILKIKQKANELKIDYLDRKWNIINDDLITSRFFRKIEDKVIQLYKEGYNLHKISKILNVNYHSLVNHKKEIIKKSSGN